MDLNGYNVDSSADPAITANVNEQVGQSNQDVASRYNGGIPQARGLLSSGGDSGGLAYGDHATSAAIRSRYSMPYMREENQLKLDNMRNAATDHLRNLTVASQAAGQEVEDNRQKAILKWKVDQANRKARGAVLGSVLGIIGGVAGGVGAGMASGGAAAPAGAMGGYALGQGAGNMIGGGY